MRKIIFFIAFLFLFSCQKTEINNDSLESKPEIFVTSKNVLFTPEQMAQISFGQHPDEVKSTEQQIAVFPLVLDSEPSSIYAVVNYTDSTTLLTTSYVNYPDNFIAFFDKMVIDSTERAIIDMPEVLANVLRGYDADIERFSKDPVLVNAPLGYVPTKLIDDEFFMPPPGCRVEIETTGTYGKSNECYGPLTHTMWDQGGPYNRSIIPSGCKVGCVAIAIGQLMRYHEHPASLPYCGIVEYSNMPMDGTVGSFTPDFLYYIGKEVKMNYGLNSSGAYMDPDGQSFLSRYYHVTMEKIGSRFQYKHMATVRSEMKNSRPIVVRGVGGVGAHAWIIDGYDDVSRMATQIYRYYDQNNKLIYIQHLENPIAAFFCFHHNLGWGKGSDTWINAYADMSFGASTYNEDVKVFYVSK